jgi:hypothetical protein
VIYDADCDADDDETVSSTNTSAPSYYPYCTNTLKTSKELKMERERLRQEKLSQFAKDSWRHQAERSETKPTPGFDDPFFAAFDKMMGSGPSRNDDFVKFFSEAEKRFANNGFGARDTLFTKFFSENRERFAEMKEEMRRRREESFSSDFDDFFNRVASDWRRADPFGKHRSSFDSSSSSSREESATKSSKNWSNLAKDGEFENVKEDLRSESVRRSFSSSSGFDSCSDESGAGKERFNPRHTHFGSFGFPPPPQSSGGRLFQQHRKNRSTGEFMTTAASPKFTTSFNGFTRFTPIIVSPPGNGVVAGMNVTVGKNGYQMKTQRSTFEYDGNTNTYK